MCKINNREELEKCLRGTMSVYDIMEQFNCSRNTVISAMNRWGLKTPKGLFATGKKVGRPKGTKQPPSAIKHLKGRDNPFYGKRHSEQTKLKMSQNHADFTKDKNPYRIFINTHPEAKAAASERAKQYWSSMSEEEREKRSRTLSLAIANSEYHKNFSSLKCHQSGHLQTKKGGRIFCRSSWEQKFALFLDAQPEVSSFACEPFCIEYHDNNGKRRYTRPDFLVSLENFTWLVEIKPSGLIAHRNNSEKIAAMEEYAHTHRMQFSLLTETQMMNLRKELEHVSSKLD